MCPSSFMRMEKPMLFILSDFRMGVYALKTTENHLSCTGKKRGFSTFEIRICMFWQGKFIKKSKKTQIYFLSFFTKFRKNDNLNEKKINPHLPQLQFVVSASRWNPQKDHGTFCLKNRNFQTGNAVVSHSFCGRLMCIFSSTKFYSTIFSYIVYTIGRNPQQRFRLLECRMTCRMLSNV